MRYAQCQSWAVVKHVVDFLAVLVCDEVVVVMLLMIVRAEMQSEDEWSTPCKSNYSDEGVIWRP